MSLQLTCKKQNCTNSPIPRGKFCNDHRTMKKMCIAPDCKSGARCKTNHCVAHGGGKRCKTPDCNVGAYDKFGYCIAHGGGKRCKIEECKTGAINKTGYCVTHGGGKKCKILGCKSSAQGNTICCKAHGGGKRCVTLGCNTSAFDKSGYCITHGGGKRCKIEECKASAQGKTVYCIAHGGGKRCPNCVDWIDSRCGQTKYDGYCATCFKRVFPTDPRSTVIYEHTKEIRVRNAINQQFEGFIHDRPLYTGNCDCTHRRRIDHRRIIGNTIIAVETDEFGHRSYDERDEEIRYDDLYMVHSGKWIFIRFNPDNTKTQQTDLDDRIIVLLDVIETQVERVMTNENTEPVEIIKLFY